MNRGTLDSFGLWCPFCGKKTIRKTISPCKFILCENFISCNYFKIIEYDLIDSNNENFNNNIKNNEKQEDKENHCIKKLKQFIHDEKIAKNNRILNEKNQYGKKSSKATLKDNELGINKNEEEKDINLIMNILNEGKREKSKIELFREENRIKKANSDQRRIAKQQKRRSKRFKKEKEKQREKEEKLKKEEFKKEKAILKIFKEKYQKLFNGEELSHENISKTHFTDEEIKVGLKEYEKKQLLLEKEAKDRKEKERI
ncbi:MAG: hypothetical protein FWH29_08210, partial [Methanobrevibacter sp.]|nr:hypothetical protein [Methanobrevibacter sp.]